MLSGHFETPLESEALGACWRLVVGLLESVLRLRSFNLRNVF